MSSQPAKVSTSVILPQIIKPWSPKLLGNLNGEYDFKIVRLRGSYIFHAHPDTDEIFYIVSGTLNMRLKEPGNETTLHLEDVLLNAGDVFTVPKGIRHCPTTVGEDDVISIIVEKVGTLNSGNAGVVEGLTNEVEDVRDKF